MIQWNFFSSPTKTTWIRFRRISSKFSSRKLWKVSFPNYHRRLLNFQQKNSFLCNFFFHVTPNTHIGKGGGALTSLQVAFQDFFLQEKDKNSTAEKMVIFDRLSKPMKRIPLFSVATPEKWGREDDPRWENWLITRP